MQFNKAIVLRMVTYNDFAEEVAATSYDVKCAVLEFTKKPSKADSDTTKIRELQIIVKYKNLEPYVGMLSDDDKMIISAESHIRGRRSSK
jgi:hypothetical protein